LAPAWPGIIVNQTIEPAFADPKGGKMLLEHNGNSSLGVLCRGPRHFRSYGKLASEITSAKDWKKHRHDMPR